ncbi:hypothetical protein [Amycolatopsis thermoflava]|uniref:hypothetical protein n=1 Tax=Amycolatopsis thermoflava TaxID=84480 RepID=UPI003F4A82E4
MTGLARDASGLRLRLPDATILADTVVLTTGHSDLEPSEEDRRLRPSGLRAGCVGAVVELLTGSGNYPEVARGGRR